MFRSSSNFDKLLEKATSNLLLDTDWPTILQICDLIRQGDVQPKYALVAIKKKMYNANPHIAMFALLVLESCVKNCGHLIHDEVGTKQYMEQLRELVKTTGNENVKNKVLELIQAWAYAFRNSPKYRAVQDTLNIMKTEGYKFPTLKESDAMFSADTAPAWADGEVCHRCRVQFGMVQRKHHCRACGQVFCAQCSSKTSTLPKFGIEKEVRVCEACYEAINRPAALPPKTESSDLPPEYVSSVLSQQSQAPSNRKTDEELREEEELQLALALSKSEAEHKEKEKKRNTSAIISNAAAATRAKQYSPPPPTRSSPDNQDEEMDPELARYLNRSYWEKRQSEDNKAKTPQNTERDRASPSTQQPSAPSTVSSPMVSSATPKLHRQENGETDGEIEEFVAGLKSQLEIFVNRMKSNSSRGRSIANDSSVQTLFMNITAMHSRLLRYIQQQDDGRVYYEGLQDKMAQVKDARAALDALREEHQEKLRRQAEEAERIRQMQMAHKLEIMRKKKQEYLQYQRQLALQRIQEQEREMQIRQEQQKQQYLMGSMPYSMPFIPPGHPSQPYPQVGTDNVPPHSQFPVMPQGSFGALPPGAGVNQYPGFPPPPGMASLPQAGPSSGAPSMGSLPRTPQTSIHGPLPPHMMGPPHAPLSAPVHQVTIQGGQPVPVGQRLPQGLPQGVAPPGAQVVTAGPPPGVAPGPPQALPQALPQPLQQPMPQGPPQNVAQGPPQGTPPGAPAQAVQPPVGVPFAPPGSSAPGPGSPQQHPPQQSQKLPQQQQAPPPAPQQQQSQQQQNSTEPPPTEELISFD